MPDRTFALPRSWEIFSKSEAKAGERVTLDQMLHIAAKVDEENRRIVEDFRQSAPANRCRYCGHVMQITDDGAEIEICEHLEFYLKSAAPPAKDEYRNPVAQTLMGIRVRVAKPPY